MSTTTSFADLLREQEELAGWIQRFWTNVTKLGRDKLTRATLEQRKGLLERYWDSFILGHRKLMRCKEAAASTYAVQDVFSIVEEAYLTAGSMMSQHLEAFSTSASPHSVTDPRSTGLHPQLPKIPLPTFSGDPLLWESFRDLFRSLVHDVPHLPDVQKLLYLQSSLRGEAADVIRNTPTTDSVYRGAWEDLELRYGNTRLLSFEHHRALLACPPAKKQSAAELKRVLDFFKQTIRAYTALRKPVNSWDEWLVYLLSQKLDTDTHLAWETSLANTRDIPSFQSLSQFLENRIQALGAAGINDTVLRPTSASKSKDLRPSREPQPATKIEAVVRKRNSSVLATSTKAGTAQRVRTCPQCSGNHVLCYCTKFKNSTPTARMDCVKRLKVCFNCLNQGHSVNDCPSKQSCFTCKARHHTLLHEVAFSGASTISNEEGSPSEEDSRLPTTEEPRSATTLSVSACTRSVALLATARVILEAPTGSKIEVRALLDTGSDTSLVSSWVAQALRLPRRAVRVSISGVQDNETGVATSEVSLVVRSRLVKDFHLPVKALVLRRLTSMLPARRVLPKSWPHISGIELADPDFGIPARVDLILGSDVCGILLQEGTRTGPQGTPIAKNTPFGWVLVGPTCNVQPAAETKARALHCRAEDTTGQLLQRFWEIEEVGDQPPLSEEEERCERHFRDTHARDHSGRFIVRLPFSRSPEASLSPCRNTALKLLLSCERRNNSDAVLKDQYIRFMSEYRSLGHMELVPEADENSRTSYYLPHHGVRKRHDPSGKLRVVFNASFQTATGFSLNDCLLTGPKLQADLWMVLTRWRLFKVVFTADIVKMFRQIRVHPDDATWQRILWRPDPAEKIQEFKLTTVTYGTACAPFLALRVLIQLASDEQDRFPLGAEAVRNHSYVDDILTGADDIEQALKIKEDIISLFRAASFELSKWASNVPQLQGSNPTDVRLFQEWEDVSTLGINWDPKGDTFSLRVASPKATNSGETKRGILSEIARLFDPLGWAAPVLIGAKILMQDLWILGIEWDQVLPEEVVTRWRLFRDSLQHLENLTIPRWAFTTAATSSRAQLHGFCDASQRAYAAAVYLRVEYQDHVTTTLLVAKTKVAPVKTITIPKLELCGAALLSKLLAKVKEGLNLPTPVTAWTDSSVTLYWIRGHASQWKPFVAHRVADIQLQTPPDNWRHVRSEDNPADPATRGITPGELMDSNLWWYGPAWLRSSPSCWPSTLPDHDASVDEERRRATVLLSQEDPQESLLDRFSSISRLLTTIAWCFRFTSRCRRETVEHDFVTAAERANALRVALRISKGASFPEDIRRIRQGRELPKKSALSAFRPFLDDQGLLRIGGRLENSALPYNEVHPYLVSKKCPLARLLVRDAHLRTLHGGPQLTRSLLTRRFWIIHGRSIIRQEIANCSRCVRFSGQQATQLMGQLPTERATPQRPFLTSGVDYAGPIRLRTSPGRGHKSYKGYISLFVCLSTRAIHLEAVSDLSSAAFLAAFRRFVGRRGRCATLLSDNGTTFQGADRELRTLFSQASTLYKEAAPQLAVDGTEWRFIPPYAPHFGGLWEAGVKSVKHHLRRTIGDATLTFEELSTLLCQIEACLNSRPLYALSDDPLDSAALTPGHFLVGEPTSVLPEPEEPDHALGTRWRHIQLMKAQFWNRWRHEYLRQLQQLSKWRQPRDDLKIGTLTLIRDDNQPPAKWPMGRVVSLHPGPDGRTRVVTLKTATGMTKRAITKLVPLPVWHAKAS